jgi:hypothetical protein
MIVFLQTSRTSPPLVLCPKEVSAIRFVKDLISDKLRWIPLSFFVNIDPSLFSTKVLKWEDFTNRNYYPSLFHVVGHYFVKQISFPQLLLPEDSQSVGNATTNSTHSFLLWGMTFRIVSELIEMVSLNPIHVHATTHSTLVDAMIYMLELFLEKKDRGKLPKLSTVVTVSAVGIVIVYVANSKL